jgi:hypothetical protein
LDWFTYEGAAEAAMAAMIAAKIVLIKNFILALFRNKDNCYQLLSWLKYNERDVEACGLNKDISWTGRGTGFYTLQATFPCLDVWKKAPSERPQTSPSEKSDILNCPTLSNLVLLPT